MEWWSGLYTKVGVFFVKKKKKKKVGVFFPCWYRTSWIFASQCRLEVF